MLIMQVAWPLAMRHRSHPTPFPNGSSAGLEVLIELGFEIIWQRQDDEWFWWLVGPAAWEFRPSFLGTGTGSSIAGRC